MSEQAMLSAEFIKQICATYQMHDPLIAAAQQEHRELKTYVALLRTMCEMADEVNPEAIAVFTRLIAHMDNTMAMLKRIQSFTRQADMVMKEHTG